jgi:GDP-4-dehydro-6-deoxy-D-mannose reductase
MKVLVTGAKGFTGRHFLEYLRSDPDIDVVGLDCELDDQLVNYVCDLKDYDLVSGMLKTINPDRIYNYAGSITNDYHEAYVSNVLITKNLLDSLADMKYAGRLLLVGSSAEYGMVNVEDFPVKEDQPPNPVSMYGLTKVYQTYMMKMYRILHDLDVVMVRPFNLIGEGISENLFPGRVQNLIHDFKVGKIKKIRIGNLHSRRDYIHISKAVEAYHLVMEAGVAGEVYNIGTGKSMLLRDLLRAMLGENGLDMSVIEEMPRSENNKLDVPDMYADITKLINLKNRSKKE